MWELFLLMANTAMWLLMGILGTVAFIAIGFIAKSECDFQMRWIEREAEEEEQERAEAERKWNERQAVLQDIATSLKSKGGE